MDEQSLQCSSDTTHLSTAVHTAVQTFLDHMDGHDCSGLYDLVLKEVERPLLECVMNDCRGNQTRAAKLLGISRGNLRTKLARYDML